MTMKELATLISDLEIQGMSFERAKGLYMYGLLENLPVFKKTKAERIQEKKKNPPKEHGRGAKKNVKKIR